MKQQTGSIDTRIQKFMSKKMSKFPELSEHQAPRDEVELRGYSISEFLAVFNRKTVS